MIKGELIALVRKWYWLITLVIVVVGMVFARFLQTDPNYTDCIGQSVDTARQIAACTQVIEYAGAGRRSVAYVMRGNV